MRKWKRNVRRQRRLPVETTFPVFLRKVVSSDDTGRFPTTTVKDTTGYNPTYRSYNSDEPVGAAGFAKVYEDSEWREPEDVWRSRYHAQMRPKEKSEEEGAFSSVVKWFGG
eukprot:symbB.v1.2.024144.t1/scaffold2265.1/size102435/4